MRLDKIKKQVNEIEGWFGDGDMEIFHPYIEVLKPRDLLVEIGTYHGKSTLFFRLANPQIRILTVDICNQRGALRPQTKIPKAIDDKVLSQGGIFQVRGDSYEVVKGFNWDINFLFIDSYHTFADTYSTLSSWSRHVVPGGIIACHDYNAEFPGVMEAVAKYLKLNKKIKIISNKTETIFLKK